MPTATTMPSDIKSLIDSRRDWVESSKKNNFDFDGILSGLYADPSHFVYEILQNAEDTSATKVSFSLFEDRLEIRHDGRDFNFGDVDGVTGIGISTKKTDLTAIGKFGVGFKSVFAITKTPCIYSGQFSFHIEDYVVPVEEPKQDGEKETLIILPFNHATNSREIVFEKVAKKLENIGVRTLLFLNNIEEIKWSSPRGDGHYLKEKVELEGANRETVISNADTEEYIVINRPIEIDGANLKVEIAYKIGRDKKDKEILVPAPDSKLVVYFPTEKVTFLDFLIQGPFKTTPNRENIPEDNEQNKKIIEEIGQLVADSLTVIKRLGYLDTNLVKLLPIIPDSSKKSSIYSTCYRKVKEKLLSEENLLPTTQDGEHVSANAALLARGQGLVELLKEEDVQRLFNKQQWLDRNITDDKARELINYLISELKVKEVDFEDFAKSITPEFLGTKSDGWMIDFYSRLLDQRTLWREKGILRAKPIIRLENNEHIAPYDGNGRVQVYLPSESKSAYKTVKRELTHNESALKFLRELGITEPDLFAEVQELILPKYKNEKASAASDYFEDFEKIFRAYEQIPSNKKGDYEGQLKDTPFILSSRGAKQNELFKPTSVYFDSDDLKTYFVGNEDTCFISGDLVKKLGEGRKEQLERFLKEVGVANAPRPIKREIELSKEKKVAFRGNSGCTNDLGTTDYELEGLETFLEAITLEKSCLLWKIILTNINEYQAAFQGKYRWKYYDELSRSFDSFFLETLKQKKWLEDKKGGMRQPSDLSISDLHDSYDTNDHNVTKLSKALQFKPGIIDQLDPEDKRRLEYAKKIPLELLEKLAAKSTGPSDNTAKWGPEYSSREIPAGIIQAPSFLGPEVTPTISTSSQSEKDRNPGKDTDKGGEERSAADKKAIGAWGEEFVYEVLKEKSDWAEVVWLNKDGNVGEGCDFIIKKNGAEIEFIEVKTKLGSENELIEITGTQWECARTKGDKYSIYVVSNAGTKDAKITRINNPIERWKNGELYAHPIRFEL